MTDPRPRPKDLSHHLSRNAKNRQASSIKAFYKYFAIPGIGQLAGGLPNNYYFPFDTLEAKIARPSRWRPTPNKPVDGSEEFEQVAVGKLDLSAASSPLGQPQDALVVPHFSPQQNPIKRIDLSTALQYGAAQGYPPLYYFARQFTQEILHPNCPYRDGPEVLLTCGNTDGFSKVLQLLTNEWSKDHDRVEEREGVLVEKFTYMNAVQTATPRGLAIVPVEIDDEGMRASGAGGLEDVLENWDSTRGKRPHVIYTVTIGQNPTSGVLSLQRRRELYAICVKYDVMIVEDEPYWYLQFPSATSRRDKEKPQPSSSNSVFANNEALPTGWKSSGHAFIDSLVPSFVSIDTDGRVLRLDTFSKTVAPGCRLGWITAQPALVERLLRITETSTQQPSGFVQSMIAEMILGPDHAGLEEARAQKGGKGGVPNGQGWKADGWVRWLEGLRGNYERRMNRMCRILEDNKYLVKSGRRLSLADAVSPEEDVDEWSVVEKTQMYSFDWPVGGMFIWLRIAFETHPLYKTYAKGERLQDLSHALWLYWTSKPYLVLVSPGTIFSSNAALAKSDGWRFFRLCFAAIDQDVLPQTTERLCKGVASFWRIKDQAVIEKILDDDKAGDASSALMHGQDVELARMFGPC